MKEKINQLQFLSIIIVISLASFIGIGIFTSSKIAGVDSCISVLIAGVTSLILVYFFITIFNYEQDLPIKDKVIKLFGKTLGTIINLTLIFSAFVMGISVIFNLISFIESQLLLFTPSYIIGIPFVLTVIYASSKDIQDLSRLSFVLTIINICLYLVAVVYLLSNLDVSNFYPILANGIKAPLKGSFYISMLNILPYFLILCIPKSSLNSTKKVNRNIILTYIVAIILMFFVVFSTLGNLGEDLLKIYQYPEYIVLKKINYFNFINHVENFVSIQWIFGLFFNLTLIVFFIKTFFKDKKIGKKKTLPIITTFSIYIVSTLVFKNIFIFNNYVYNYALYFRYVLLAALVLIVIKIIFLKRKNSSIKK